MIQFLLKKIYYDIWDNIFQIVLINLFFIVSVSFILIFAYLFSFSSVLTAVLSAVVWSWVFICLSAVSKAVIKISDNDVFRISFFFEAISKNWISGLKTAILAAAFVLPGYAVFFIYPDIRSLAGIIALGFIASLLLIFMMSIQFYFPLRARMENKHFKALLKSLFIFADNPGIVIFCFFHNILILALSFFAAFLLPGITAIQLTLDEALRLLVMKYDYLDNHPDADRKKNLWDIILKDEIEKTGTRRLRDFFKTFK